MRAQLEYRSVEVKGNTVECEPVGRRSLRCLPRMAKNRHFRRFVFKDGSLLRKEWRGSAGQTDRTVHSTGAVPEPDRRPSPGSFPHTFGPEGSCKFSRESGAPMRKLAQQWEEAGAPGRLKWRSSWGRFRERLTLGSVPPAECRRRGCQDWGLSIATERRVCEATPPAHLQKSRNP